jgi:conjugal transfer pilus assembly protein TraF
MKKIILLSVLVCSVFALNDFFEDSKNGYFYYRELPPETEKNINKNDKNSTLTKVISTADYNSTFTKMSIPFEDKKQRQYRREQEKKYVDNIPWHDLNNLSADEYRRLMDTTREIAVATPSKQYVKSYASLQKFWVDKSEKFAKVWSVANLENPDELIYPKFEFSASGRKIRYKEKKKENKDFFTKFKDTMGYIVVIEDKNDAETYNRFDYMYKTIKEQTGLEYMIVDYYDIPQLARKLKIDLKTLPENFIMYRGNKNKEVYKRVAKGYASATQIVENTRFVFDNAILEEDKRPEHRAE